MLSDLSVDRFLNERPLCITLAGLEEMRGQIEARLAVFGSAPRAFVDDLVAARTAAAAPSQPSRRNRAGAVGVIQIRGSIAQHEASDISSFLFGGSTTEGILNQFREFMADEEIGKIVLDIDSPGGTSYGATELWQEIYKARGEKPIVAVANSLAASKAYWIGSAADYFYVTPGGLVGSIGAYAIHQDISKMAEREGVKTTLISAGKYKTTGNEWEPLDEEAHARIQERVDAVYDQFVHDVARGRGVSEATVRNGFGEGDVVTAKRAKAEGMADGIATLEQVIGRSYKPRATAGLIPEEQDAPAAESSEASLDTEASESIQHPEQRAERDNDGEKRLGRMRMRRLAELAAMSSAVAVEV